MARSVEELRRESELGRARLVATVDQVRERITHTAEDLRYKVSPEGLKSEVSDFVSRKTQSWLGALKQQAMENPMQAIAAGTAIAVPAPAAGAGLSAAPFDDRRRPGPEFEDRARPRGGGGCSGDRKG